MFENILNIIGGSISITIGILILIYRKRLAYKQTQHYKKQIQILLKLLGRGYSTRWDRSAHIAQIINERLFAPFFGVAFIGFGLHIIAVSAIKLLHLY